MRILLLPYDHEWPAHFQRERENLTALIGNFSPAIEHIGSTAVEGMTAKPVIDIAIGFDGSLEMDGPVKALQAGGYIYVRKFEGDTLSGRKFMIRVDNMGSWAPRELLIPEGGNMPDIDKFPRRVHLHIVEADSHAWKSHLIFRNYLRTHPDLATEYLALKMQLASQEWEDDHDYARAKGAIVRKIEALANAEKWPLA